MRILLLAFVLIPVLASAQPKPAELDQLLTALALAPSEEVAGRLELRITTLWLRSGGPAAALLLGRGARDLSAGDAQEAVADFDAALALAPENAQIFGRRALARYHAGDVRGAVHDLEEAIRREPRDFGAWRSLSGIAEAQGNDAGALAAWKQLLLVDPKTAGGAERLKALTKKVEGEDS